MSGTTQSQSRWTLGQSASLVIVAFSFAGLALLGDKPNAGFLLLLAAFLTVSLLVFHALDPILLIARNMRRGISDDIFIEADAEAVWSVFAPNPKPDCYHLGIKRIDALSPQEDGVSRIALVRDVLPDDLEPDLKQYENTVEVIEAGRHIRLHAELGRFFGGIRPITADYEIMPAEGGTWVRYAEEVEYERFADRVVLALLAPATDSLQSLKAICEGREDLSSNGRMNAARRSGEDPYAAFLKGQPYMWLLPYLPWVKPIVVGTGGMLVLPLIVSRLPL